MNHKSPGPDEKTDRLAAGWGFLAAGIYVLILTVVLVTLAVGILPDKPSELTWIERFLHQLGLIFNVRDGWGAWIYLLALFLAQVVFLSVPVDSLQKRPRTRRSVIPLIVTAALLMALLAFGAMMAIDETLTRGGGGNPMFRIMLGVSVLTWAFWAKIFYRWSAGREPLDLISRQCRCFFYGSILELLIAVPAHIIARQRDYCCAGVQTFLGIAFGISVMLFCFGPGVFFLYRKRLQNLRRAGHDR